MSATAETRIKLWCTCCGAAIFSPAGWQPCPSSIDGYHCNNEEAKYLSADQLANRCLEIHVPGLA